MKFRINTRTTGFVIEKLQQHNQWRKYAGPFNNKSGVNSKLRELRKEFGLGSDDVMQNLVSKPWDKRIFGRSDDTFQ